MYYLVSCITIAEFISTKRQQELTIGLQRLLFEPIFSYYSIIGEWLPGDVNKRSQDVATADNCFRLPSIKTWVCGSKYPSEYFLATKCDENAHG